MINHTTSLTDLFNEAVAMTYNLQPDEKFIVKNLFRGFEWERLPIGTRIKLGSMFFNYVCNDSSTIEPLSKTAQHQQIYIKTTSQQQLLINNLLSDYDIKHRLLSIPSDTTFILKDLFTDAEWSYIENNATHSSYGKAFAAIIKENPNLKVEFILPKTGSQRYRKL